VSLPGKRLFPNNMLKYINFPLRRKILVLEWENSQLQLFILMIVGNFLYRGDLMSLVADCPDFTIKSAP
jgi:hypothetical protein